VTLAAFTNRITGGFRTSAALGLRPLTTPVMLFIPLGIILGPQASGVLSEEALAHLDVVVSIVLATLGVFIGVAAGREARSALRLVAAATIEGGMTILIVAAALAVLLRIWGIPLDMSYSLAALALAVCASASAAPSVEAGDERGQIAARVADLDDVLPIVLGAMVLVLAGPVQRPVLQHAALTVGIGMAIGVGGWLLLERPSGPAERAVFVLGSLALLGGAPAYLGLSPLLAGMSAGLLWVLAPGQADVLVARELRKVQHPLIVLLLITAGAGLKATAVGVWLFAPYVVFRFAGKILGGWTASRIAPGIAPSGLGAYLIPPGAIGLAFALNLQQVAHEAATPIVLAVALGAIACEALAFFVTPVRRSA
jgi:hypothetical protein